MDGMAPGPSLLRSPSVKVPALPTLWGAVLPRFPILCQLMPLYQHLPKDLALTNPSYFTPYQVSMQYHPATDPA